MYVYLSMDDFCITEMNNNKDIRNKKEKLGIVQY